MSETPGSRD